MKQCSSILNLYASDVSGVCSALYELGGMTIMDDASGCNSTYNTHDEPRWYTIPSMVYVSALTELQAVLGHDDHLADEICTSVAELHPRFVAIAGTPIPMMMGTDFVGLARVIEKRCGVPVMGFDTNGMHSYIEGAGRAFAEFARRFCCKRNTIVKSNKPRLNIIGATPLDFSVTGNLQALKDLLTSHGYEVVSVWAMGSTFDQLMDAPSADVNVVVSSCGIETARYFEREFSIPYVVGIPTGSSVTDAFFASIDAAVRTHTTQKPLWHGRQIIVKTADAEPSYVIGETVWASCMSLALAEDFSVQNVHVLSGCDFNSKYTGISQEALLGPCGQTMVDEDSYFSTLKHSPLVIADPLYKYAVSKNTKFISLPHEGYSGRIFRNSIPVVMGKSFDNWVQENL